MTKFRIIEINNASFDWKRRKRKKRPKMTKSIRDNDLAINKGESFDLANLKNDDYGFKGQPYGSDKPHV